MEKVGGDRSGKEGAYVSDGKNRRRGRTEMDIGVAIASGNNSRRRRRHKPQGHGCRPHFVVYSTLLNH